MDGNADITGLSNRSIGTEILVEFPENLTLA
jgi:hypothetical protein